MKDLPSTENLDRVIHERARLGIVSSLAARRQMTFVELKQGLGLSDGNLSVHARVLEHAGYIRIKKTFVARKPRTAMSLTPKGRTAFRRYVDELERIVSLGKRK